MVTIVSRDAWDARSPKRAPHRIATPTKELWLHHFAAASWVGASGMWHCQNFHMDTRRWNDIAYSFCIDPRDGTIYEGRGAGVAGGHTSGHNTIAHAICFQGNTDETPPSDAAIRAAAELAAHGQRQGWWGDWTGGHQQASGASTACPGRHGMAALPKIRELTAALLSPAPIIQSPTEDDPMHLLIVNDLYAEAGRKPGTDASGRAYWALELRKREDDIDSYLELVDYIAGALR